MTPGSANLLLAAGGGYQISRSLRLRSSASAYLNRTPASASNRTTWTFSIWVKRGQIAREQHILDAGALTGFQLYWNASDQLQFSEGASVYGPTTMVFRDASAWYHIVFVWDTTQATAANRVRLYVNGVEFTAGLTYPAQNTNSSINAVLAHYIGRYQGSGAYYYDGLYAETYLIDGQALTPSSFGETDTTTGVWKPKAYTGTYGTNGFYLNFSDNSAATAAAIGKDYSGNGNNWTPNNISVTAGSTYDSMIDTPTPYDDGGNGRGNYCVLNPLDDNANMAPSDANLTWANAGATQYSARSTVFFPSSGKWYAEFTLSSSAAIIGIADQSAPVQGFTGLNGVFAVTTAIYNNSGSATQSGLASFATSDIIAVAYDAGANSVQFYRNNSTFGTALTPSSSGPFCFFVGANGSACTINSNFGQRPFAYTPPSGYKALNTQNLPTPTIANGNTYFAATTYSGSTSSQTISNAINGVGFQPDLVWAKVRSNTYNHALLDSSRGQNYLSSNTTTGDTATGGVTFTSTGVTWPGGASLFNDGGQTYVAWQWKKGATPGFDVVTYTGPSSPAAQSVSHSLGVKPDMMIVKARNLASRNWAVYHKSLGATQCLRLNLTNAAASVSTYWNNTEPTSSVFTVGTDNDTNANTYNYVAYLFAEVAGFSKFGSYTGNGSADGPFVYCGFRPKYVLVKNTNSGVENWWQHDTAREPYNTMTVLLAPDSNTSEVTNTQHAFDFLSNGFKIRTNASGANGSSQTIIFAAFAENPFKYSLAR